MFKNLVLWVISDKYSKLFAELKYIRKMLLFVVSI